MQLPEQGCQGIAARENGCEKNSTVNRWQSLAILLDPPRHCTNWPQDSKLMAAIASTVEVNSRQLVYLPVSHDIVVPTIIIVPEKHISFFEQASASAFNHLLGVLRTELPRLIVESGGVDTQKVFGDSVVAFKFSFRTSSASSIFFRSSPELELYSAEDVYTGLGLQPFDVAKEQLLVTAFPADQLKHLIDTQSASTETSTEFMRKFLNARK